MEFLVGGQATNQSFCKKRKVSLGGSSSWGEDSLAPTKNHLTFLDDEPIKKMKMAASTPKMEDSISKKPKSAYFHLKFLLKVYTKRICFPTILMFF